MGLSPTAVKLLIRAHKKHNFSGRVITLGSQDVLATFAQLRRWFEDAGCPSMETTPTPHCSRYIREVLGERGRDFVHARTLFEMMGMPTYADLDLLDIDGAALRHDLNEAVPDDWMGRYGLVLDAGTTEHIFDVRQSLENTARICAVGGYVLHMSPVVHYLDHSFYSLHPTLYFDFYQANGFDGAECTLWAVNPNSYFEKCPFWSYAPGDAGPNAFGHWPGRYLYQMFIARRRELCETFSVPMQGYYQETPAQFGHIAPMPDAATGARRLIGSLMPAAWRNAIARQRRARCAPRI